MKIEKFIAVFDNTDAAINFANIIAKEFCYLIKGCSIHVTDRKIINTKTPLFAVDGEKLNSIANKSGNLIRVSY